MMRRNSMDRPLLLSDMCFALLGEIGAGKSSSGNTILGREAFEVGFLSEHRTRICQRDQTEVDGQKITVIDTLGLPDNTMKPQETLTKIKQIFDCTLNGIDVFLLVIKLGDKSTEEQQENVKWRWIQEIFGAKALKHTLVLFTHGDHLHEPVEKCLHEYKTLRSAVDQCSGGYHVFSNRDEDRSQVTELLRKIETLRMMNGVKYTEQDYEKNLDEKRRNRVAEEKQLRVFKEDAERQQRLLKRAEEDKTAGLLVASAAGGWLGAEVGFALVSQMGAAALDEGKKAAGASLGAAIGAAALGAGVYFIKKERQLKQLKDLMT